MATGDNETAKISGPALVKSPLGTPSPGYGRRFVETIDLLFWTGMLKRMLVRNKQYAARECSM